MSNTVEKDRSQVDVQMIETGGSEGARLSPTKRFISRLLRNRGAMIGLTIVSIIVFGALAAEWIAPFDPNEQFGVRRLEGPSDEFLLGTDNLGRDIFSRLLYGARPSVGSAAVATFVILIIGIGVGAWAGYSGGIIDEIAMRIVDVLLAFPTLILALAIVGVLGPGLENMLLAITAIGYAAVWIDGWLRPAGRAETIGKLLGLPGDKVVRIILPIGAPEYPVRGPEKKPFDQRAWFNSYGR